MAKPKADLTLVFGKPGRGMDSEGDGMDSGDMEDGMGAEKFDEVAAEVMPDVEPDALRRLLDAYMEERGM